MKICVRQNVLVNKKIAGEDVHAKKLLVSVCQIANIKKNVVKMARRITMDVLESVKAWSVLAWEHVHAKLNQPIANALSLNGMFVVKKEKPMKICVRQTVLVNK